MTRGHIFLEDFLLEELLDMCGEDFHALTRTDNGWEAEGTIYEKGQTPTEAVVSLLKKMGKG